MTGVQTCALPICVTGLRTPESDTIYFPNDAPLVSIVTLFECPLETIVESVKFSKYKHFLRSKLAKIEFEILIR